MDDHRQDLLARVAQRAPDCRVECLRSGALYYPWLWLPGAQAPQPPSGHLAGVYALSDGKAGPHRAPANETIAEDSPSWRLDVMDDSQASLTWSL